MTINGKEYITVKEFAELIGYTPQGVYKLIKQNVNNLNSFVETVKSIKYIEKSVVPVFIRKSQSFENSTVETNTFNTCNTSSNSSKVEPTGESETIFALVEMLKAELEAKQKQLEQKDKQIEELNKRLAEITEVLAREQGLSALHTQQNTLLLKATTQDKKGLFRRLFSKKQKQEKDQQEQESEENR